MTVTDGPTEKSTDTGSPTSAWSASVAMGSAIAATLQRHHPVLGWDVRHVEVDGVENVGDPTELFARSEVVIRRFPPRPRRARSC
ncbi:MAG: hypothetical protein U5K81_13305 [Trueperaceae bacterium]|nr:hypothetical protein [Trueperaceae bacterium]